MIKSQPTDRILAQNEVVCPEPEQLPNLILGFAWQGSYYSTHTTEQKVSDWLYLPNSRFFIGQECCQEYFNKYGLPLFTMGISYTYISNESISHFTHESSHIQYHNGKNDCTKNEMDAGSELM